MSDSVPNSQVPPLELLPYPSRLVNFLKHHDPDVWNWFASSRNRASQSEELKFDLLKSTYRIDRDSQPELYETADGVKHQSKRSRAMKTMVGGIEFSFEVTIAR